LVAFLWWPSVFAIRAADEREPADLVLRHGQIYTVDAARSWAETVAIRKGRIVAVGADVSMASMIAASTRVIDLEGRMVLPGFHDSHVHPLSGGVELGQCDLNGLSTREAVFDRIRDYARAHPDLSWIVGGGFALPLFPDGNPVKEDLDRIVPERPVYLSSSDGHSAWVNSKALEVAKIDRATTDPPAGRIERRPDGEPSGTLRESAAALVSSHVPRLTSDDRAAGLRRALDMASRFGITSLIEASADEDDLESYDIAARKGWLTARVLVSQRIGRSDDASIVPRLVERSRLVAGPRLRADSAKLFIDGVIEGATAALLEPYLDRPGFRGELNFEPEKLTQIVTALFRERMQVHAHAIGDRAIRVTLDAIQAAREATGANDPRAHLAHIQLFAPADIVRFRKLGVVANFQSLWAYADSYIKDLTEPRLGPERSRWLYPIGSMLATGAVVVGGSDWSVSSMNPLDAIQIGITRVGLEDTAGAPWIPQERATLSQMLAAYTINGAWLHRSEHETGSIEPGKLADLIVLDRNLFDVEPGDIHRARVQLTLLEGDVIWSDGTLVPGVPRQTP
jgi:predicted amidohydrolase YtcJ